MEAGRIVFPLYDEASEGYGELPEAAGLSAEKGSGRPWLSDEVSQG
jgi:hypothetical protein